MLVIQLDPDKVPPDGQEYTVSQGVNPHVQFPGLDVTYVVEVVVQTVLLPIKTIFPHVHCEVFVVVILEHCLGTLTVSVITAEERV